MFIRPIQQEDNAAMAAIIRKVLTDMGAPKVGTAYADPQLDSLFETYNIEKAIYFVLVQNGAVIGGAGIGPLQNADRYICELQKMYFLPEARGTGFGKQMIDLCITHARQFGYKQCYLETMPYMQAAQALYTKTGFYHLPDPLGDTGHTACPVWMMKEL